MTILSNEVKDKQKIKTAITVIGRGPAGMLAALSLAEKGFNCHLIGPDFNQNDQRTTALMMPAINILQKFNIWQEIEKNAAALSTMRIIDGTKRLIRSPVVNFRSLEIGENAFGYNMQNILLNEAIFQKVKDNKRITTLNTSVEAYIHNEQHIDIVLHDGTTLETSLVVAADGRTSKARECAGITSNQWKYPQTAVILSFSHEYPHNNISTEFHTEDGPFTQVPLPGNVSSLVWVANPQRANELLSLGPKLLSKAIEERMQSLLGKVEVITPVQGYELAGIVPKSFAKNRTILVGEAAHVFPPIGAQGLNLGVRDANDLAQAVAQNPNDPGSKDVMNYYNRHRKPDILGRTGSVHALNRALLSNLLPAQIMRNAGLEMLRNFAPLRNFFMHEGMKPGNGIEAMGKTLLAPLKKYTTSK